jgi:hypothetical protein
MSADSNGASVQSVVHTPGPWKRYEGYGVDFRRPVITDAIPDRDGKCVANCICYVATTNGNWDGNAKLIAAAPDLLTACINVAKSMEDTQIYEPELAILRAAIRNAVGEQV